MPRMLRSCPFLAASPCGKLSWRAATLQFQAAISLFLRDVERKKHGRRAPGLQVILTGSQNLVGTFRHLQQADTSTMGWFSSSKESLPKSPDGGTVAPGRSKREACYESRDLFFDCLDANNILDANKHDAESRVKCSKEVEAYERDCIKSWVRLMGKGH